ncbi:tyrosine-type recombinase/integrase [Massilia arenae]|uniref:Tyrosine-type recombinase/integrase n=1 Tax=Massilia arenae TaxID=2603288 RepID=A0A5C7G3A9_9BURK|nr:tyrosine-type recombinase/integrase [Massilia arenae]TXF99201.1 tyrosine-type recombinase/integrase [Massilia arenae]
MSTVKPRGKKFIARFRVAGFPDKAKTFPTEEKAHKWLKEHEASVTSAGYVDPGNLTKKTFGDLIDHYVKEITLIKPLGESKRFALAAIHLALGSEKALNITAHRLIEYVKSRHEAGAGGVTIGMDIGYIKGVLSHARITNKSINMDAITDVKEFMKRISMKTKSTERDRRPTEVELTAIKKFFRNKKRQKIPMWDIIDFAIFTTMRVSEICRIVWADVNYEDQTVIIRDRKDPKEKIGNDQVVPVLDDAWKILTAQPKTDDRIFPYSAATISTIFPRACEELGIIDLHFHDLRHEGTSQLFEILRYEIQEAAVFTGHKDWKMLKRYVHLRAKDLHFDKYGKRRARRDISPELLLAAA